MLTKPNEWDDLWGSDGTRCSYRILIGSDIYTGEDDIEEGSLKISKPVFTAEKPIGNTPCFSMECCLRQKETPIPRGAILNLQIRLVNGTRLTDWVSLGVFKIHQRFKYPDGWIKLTCRDKMQMANQSYLTDDPVEGDSWPKSMKQVLEDSTARLGLTLDSRSSIQEGTAWMVPAPVGFSIRSVWSSIAAAHGGNFFITPNQTLLLAIPRAQFGDSGLLGSTFVLGESVLGTEGEEQVHVELSEEGYETLGDATYVDRVSLVLNDLVFYYGDSGDNNISVECYYASSEAAVYAKNELSEPLYYPVKASAMVFDPLAEIQDTYLVGDLPVVWSELITTFGIVPLSEGIAEAMSEPASEYGFEDTPLHSLKTSLKDTIDKEVSSLDQDAVFNKLTNNGTAQGLYIHKGQIYINAAYLASGTIQADLIRSGILRSMDGSFSLNLSTGELTISGMATKSDLQSLKQEGVEKIVTPVMKYSVSDDGLRIQKPGEEIGNKMTHEGMEVSKGSEPMLRANKDGVLATDVTVRNFLNMGEYSRFEDYSDGVDTARTGCFAM